MRIEELQTRIEEPGFWDNPEASQQVMKELKNLQDSVEQIEKLYTDYEDMSLLIEMSEEDTDEETVAGIEEELEQFEKRFEELRISTLLTGPYDRDNAIVTLHAGAGGTESCDWTNMLYRMYTRWAEKKNYSVEILDYLDGVCTLEEAVYVMKRDTRHFAKRQLTWFRRERDTRWLAQEDYHYDSSLMLKKIQEDCEKEYQWK